MLDHNSLKKLQRLNHSGFLISSGDDEQWHRQMLCVPHTLLITWKTQNQNYLQAAYERYVFLQTGTFWCSNGIKSISKNVFMKGSVFPVEVSWFKPSACFGLAKMFFSLVPERQTPADQSHYPTLFLCADPTRAERGLQTSLHWLPCTCAQQGLHGLCRRAFPTRCPIKTETSTNFWSCVTMM